MKKTIKLGFYIRPEYNSIFSLSKFLLDQVSSCIVKIRLLSCLIFNMAMNLKLRFGRRPQNNSKIFSIGLYQVGRNPDVLEETANIMEETPDVVEETPDIVEETPDSRGRNP